MSATLVIRPLDFDELSLPLHWAAQEGWNPGLRDQFAFWAPDNAAFIGGFLGDELVATISAVRYDNTFGFIGFYIVSPEHRGRGFGLPVWNTGLEHLQGVSCIGLDGVVSQQDNYQKSGFIYAHRNCRYEGSGAAFSAAKHVALGEGEEIIAHSAITFEELVQFDAQHFPTQRADFLRSWIYQNNHRGFAIRRKGAICAYGMIRPCVTGHKIGPLFAQTPEQALALFSALTDGISTKDPVYIDPPATNTHAIAMVESFGMTLVFETARMYMGNAPDLPIENIYGITTFELG